MKIHCERLSRKDYEDCLVILDSAYGHNQSRNIRFKNDLETSLMDIPAKLRKYIFYGVYADEQLAGFGAIAKGHIAESIWELAWGTVHKDYQGKSLGKNLLQYRIQEVLKLKDTEEAIITINSLPSSLFLGEGFQVGFPTSSGKALLWKKVA